MFSTLFFAGLSFASNASANTTITPLPYELATTTGWKAQEETYGNTVLPQDTCCFFDVNATTTGFKVILPFQSDPIAGDSIWDYSPTGVMILHMYYYSGGEIFVANSEVYVEGDPTDAIMFPEFLFTTTTLEMGKNYFFRISVRNDTGDGSWFNLYQISHMFTYNASNPGGTAITFESEEVEPPPPEPEFHIIWKNPENNGSVNVFEHNIGVAEYYATEAGFIRYLFSTSSDLSNPFYQSSPSPANVLNASTTWLQGYSAGIFNTAWPTSTIIYAQVRYYTYLANLRTSSTIQFSLTTTSTNPFIQYPTSTIMASSTFFSGGKFADVARDRWPFAYLYDILDTFNSVQSSSTDVGFQLHIGNSQFGSSTITLFSSSTAGSALGQWIPIFRGIMVAMLYIWFIGYIWSEGINVWRSSTS